MTLVPVATLDKLKFTRSRRDAASMTPGGGIEGTTAASALEAPVPGPVGASFCPGVKGWILLTVGCGIAWSVSYTVTRRSILMVVTVYT